MSLLPASIAIAAGTGGDLAIPDKPSEYGYAPYFIAYPHYPDRVVGYEWGTEGTSVTLNIDDPLVGEEGSIEYTQTELVDADSMVNFDFGFSTYNLKQGHIVHVTDGTTTKTMELPVLSVYEYHLLDDTLSGSAPSGTEVLLQPYDGGGVSSVSYTHLRAHET